jgi:hypothetical protein
MANSEEVLKEDSGSFKKRDGAPSLFLYLIIFAFLWNK